MAFPTAITTFPVPAPTDKLNSPSHSSLHSTTGVDLTATETKVGTGASTPANNKLLIGTGAGTSAWTKDAPTGAIVGTTDIQTLTNKTLTSPAITTPTGLVKGDVGLGNVDNTSDATKDAAVSTLTNKTLTSPKINENVVLTSTATELNKLAGVTAGTTTASKALVVGASKNLDNLVVDFGLKFNSYQGESSNLRMVVTVVSNDLVLNIVGLDGNTLSATNPGYIRLGNFVRSITGALTLTLADGTGWFNSGSAEYATLERDYFAYLAWDSSNSAVRVGVATFPNARVYSDFSATSTNEKFGAFNTNPGATDDVENIGRFAATLSAGAGFTWTVPSFTTLNLIQKPWFETRNLAWTPAYSASGSMTYTTVTTDYARYQIKGDRIFIEHATSAGTTGGTANTTLISTAPYAANGTYYNSSNPAANAARVVDTAQDQSWMFFNLSTGALNIQRPTSINFGLGTGRAFKYTIDYAI